MLATPTNPREELDEPHLFGVGYNSGEVLGAERPTGGADAVPSEG